MKFELYILSVLITPCREQNLSTHQSQKDKTTHLSPEEEHIINHPPDKTTFLLRKLVESQVTKAY